MKAIYTQTWRYVVQHWWQYLAVASMFAIMVLLPAKFRGFSWSFVAILVSGTMVAWPVYRAFLFGTAFAPQATGRERGRFGFVIFLVFFAIPLVLSFAVLVGYFFIAPKLFAQSQASVLAALLTVLGQIVALLVYGTALPAAAAGDKIGPGATLARSWRSFWPVLGGLLFGPGLLMATGFGVLYVLLYVEGLADTMMTGAAVPHDLGAVGGALVIWAICLLMALAATLLAAILCRAYLDTAAPATPPQPEGAPVTP